MAVAVTVDQLSAKGHLRLAIYEDHLTGLGCKKSRLVHRFAPESLVLSFSAPAAGHAVSAINSSEPM
jgi:hypothetical protein